MIRVRSDRNIGYVCRTRHERQLVQRLIWWIDAFLSLLSDYVSMIRYHKNLVIYKSSFLTSVTSHKIIAFGNA